MYAISSVNEAKYKMFSEALKISLHTPASASVTTESINVVAPPPCHLNKVLVDKRVAEILSKEDFTVEIEGHTDDSPIATAQFPSNWELSAVRASSVVRMLINHGVGENRLSAVGLASNQPLAPNDNVENRNKNRRVTITILSPNL